MRPLLRMLLPVALVTLGGCGWLAGDEGYFRDRGDDYRKAKSIPPMQMPENKKSEAVSQLYVIPVERTDALLDREFDVPRPQPIQGNPEEKVVRIQKLGEQQWILLDEAPAESWPRVRRQRKYSTGGSAKPSWSEVAGWVSSTPGMSEG